MEAEVGVSERERRVADNEAIFREVNERVEELSDRLDVDPEIVCECGALGCHERFQIPRGLYERVRAHGRRFIVLAGHEQPEFERVVDQHGGCLIVEKIGVAGTIAERQDPRA
jgi:hypothetical protein